MILLLACLGDDPQPDSQDSAEADADADADSDTDTDTSWAEKMQSGSATVDSDYDGVEVLTWRDGDAVLCELSYTLTSTAPRDDCDSCTWAFDLEVGAVEGANDQNCFDEDVQPGSTRSYGFDPDYVGHGKALMVHQDGAWIGVSFATYEDGSFGYDWDSGAVEYEPY